MWGLIAGLILLPLMISNESLWLDELYTAQFGQQPTVKA